MEEFGSRGQRFLPKTLADLLPRLLREEEGAGSWTKVIPVHRLDRDTSGLVVFARTPAAARHLGQQFREHTVERAYLALVRGRAEDRRIESVFVRDRGDGRRGSFGERTGEGEKGRKGEREKTGAGKQWAATNVRAVERLGEYTLVECRLETGRTHQVRIHLGEAGWPLCGERVYDRPLHGKPLPDGSGASRTALHAAVLGLTHPAAGKRMHWTSPLPQDMADLVEQLRARSR
jgi:23S rRNA pseudouridine1911/1915/1917 synthase